MAIEDLTAYQRRLYSMLLSDMTPHEIAAELGVYRFSLVRTFTKIYRHMGVKSRYELQNRYNVVEDDEAEEDEDADDWLE